MAAELGNTGGVPETFDGGVKGPNGNTLTDAKAATGVPSIVNGKDGVPDGFVPQYALVDTQLVRQPAAQLVDEPQASTLPDLDIAQGEVTVIQEPTISDTVSAPREVRDRATVDAEITALEKSVEPLVEQVVRLPQEEQELIDACSRRELTLDELRDQVSESTYALASQFMGAVDSYEALVAEGAAFELETRESADEADAEPGIRHLFQGAWVNTINDGDKIPVGGSVWNDEFDVTLTVDTAWLDEKTEKFTPEGIQRMFDLDKAVFENLINRYDLPIDARTYHMLYMVQQKTDKLLQVDGGDVDTQRTEAYSSGNANLSDLVSKADCAEKVAVGKILLDKLGVQSSALVGVAVDSKNHDPLEHAVLILDDPNAEGSLVFDIGRPWAELDNYPKIQISKKRITFDDFAGETSYVIPAKDLNTGQTKYFGVGNVATVDDIHFADDEVAPALGTEVEDAISPYDKPVVVLRARHSQFDSGNLQHMEDEVRDMVAVAQSMDPPRRVVAFIENSAGTEDVSANIRAKTADGKNPLLPIDAVVQAFAGKAFPNGVPDHVTDEMLRTTFLGNIDEYTRDQLERLDNIAKEFPGTKEHPGSIEVLFEAHSPDVLAITQDDAVDEAFKILEVFAGRKGEELDDSEVALYMSALGILEHVVPLRDLDNATAKIDSLDSDRVYGIVSVEGSVHNSGQILKEFGYNANHKLVGDLTPSTSLVRRKIEDPTRPITKEDAREAITAYTEMLGIQPGDSWEEITNKKIAWLRNG